MNQTTEAPPASLKAEAPENPLDELFVITCGHCGSKHPVSAWCRDEFKKELPPKNYRCPTCDFWFALEDEPPKVYPNGFMMPGPRRVKIIRPSQIIHKLRTEKAGVA